MVKGRSFDRYSQMGAAGSRKHGHGDARFGDQAAVADERENEKGLENVAISQRRQRDSEIVESLI